MRLPRTGLAPCSMAYSCRTSAVVALDAPSRLPLRTVLPAPPCPALASPTAPCSPPSQRLVSQRSGTVFGHPSEVLREQRAERSWVLIFNAGEADEGVCAQPVTVYASACARWCPRL